MLLTKIENENQMVELRGIVKGIHDKHFKDMSKLRKMREKVDKLQREYDDSISEFKQRIGVSRESIENLMVGIYNRFVLKEVD